MTVVNTDYSIAPPWIQIVQFTIHIYACIAGMIITDEATAKRFKSWNFS